MAHELVHDERGGGVTAAGMPREWGPVVAREERRVDAEVARRLLPVAERACELLTQEHDRAGLPDEAIGAGAGGGAQAGVVDGGVVAEQNLRGGPASEPGGVLEGDVGGAQTGREGAA